MCIANHFLRNNNCVEVGTDFRIPKCKYYELETICNGCESGYFLKSDVECIETEA